MTSCTTVMASDPRGARSAAPARTTGATEAKAPLLSVVPRQPGAPEVPPLHDVGWEPPVIGQRGPVSNWNDYMLMASRVVGRFHGLYRLSRFDYEHSVQLQAGTVRRLRKPYLASVAYSEWGRADAPVVICCGGVANVAMRFHYRANDLCDGYRVICMDWLGRGRSGWLAAESDYSLETYAEQLRQMIVHLGGGPVTVLGSSMGGSAAIALMARHPTLVDRLILNDVGPHIPAARRKRRAEAIARHYVFRNPADLLRKVGASGK
ncbi:MAG: alpha/beta fold hydrolase, partial [Ideonella sp.]|nr:alpha/beta fold hydrolase [Ideonella sp.]